MVGHDPEDPKEPCDWASRSSNEGDAPTPLLSPVECQYYKGCEAQTPTYQMTLCGSEVPQDRWRVRTAGSGTVSYTHLTLPTKRIV